MTFQTLTDSTKQAAKEHGGWIAVILAALGILGSHIEATDARKAEAQHFQMLLEQSRAQQHLQYKLHGTSYVDRVENEVKKESK